MNKSLFIENPCNQQWDEMLPLGEGRYCSSCNHIIHDFSDMTNDELISILQSGKHSCGRFDKQQMGLMYELKRERNSKGFYWKGIAAAIVAGTLQLTLVNAQQPVRTKVYHKRYLGQKGDNPVVKNEEKNKTSKIEIVVLNDKNNKPIQKATVTLNGVKGITDKNGIVLFPYQPAMDSLTTFNVYVSCEQFKSNYITFWKKDMLDAKTTVRLKKQEAGKNREYIMGFY